MRLLVAAIVLTLSGGACGSGGGEAPDILSEGQGGGHQAPDPLAKDQYALDQIHGRNPLDHFRRDPAEVPIAIIDTGVALQHPDLRDRLWRAPSEVPGPTLPEGGIQGPVPEGTPGWDTIGTERPPSISPDSSPEDLFNHGTPVASVAAAESGNGIGIAGVSPNALLMPVRACWGPYECFDQFAAASMSWAVENGARVINLSLVTGRMFAQSEKAVAVHPDALFVAAADNLNRDLDVTDAPVFPCEIPQPNVICVTASAPGGGPGSCSNFGRSSVDVAAPGEGVTAAQVKGFKKFDSCGTSLAAAHVSGLGALLFGAVPEANALEVKQAILDGVRRAPAWADKVAAGGIIDVKRSLELLQDRFEIAAQSAD